MSPDVSNVSFSSENADQKTDLLNKIFPINFMSTESIDSDSKDDSLWLDELLNYISIHLYPTFGLDDNTPDGLSNHLPMVLSALYHIKANFTKPTINRQVYLKNVRHELEYLVPIEPNLNYQNEELKSWEQNIYAPFLSGLKSEYSKEKVDHFIKEELDLIFDKIFVGKASTNRPDYLIYRRFMHILIYLHVIQHDQNCSSNTLEEVLPMHLNQTVFENILSNESIYTLFSGISGGAFHPIIMLGYGILQNYHTMTLLTALAYQMYSYQNIEPKLESLLDEDVLQNKPQTTLLEILQRTDTYHPEYLGEGDFRNEIVNKGGFLIHNLIREARDLIDQKEFARQCSLILGDHNQLLFDSEDFCELALTLYLKCDKKNEMATLHSVTGCFALRLIIEHVRDEVAKKSLIGYLWETFILLYIVVGGSKALNQQEHQDNPIPNWEEIVSHLESATDEHDIKLVYTCSEECKVYPKLEHLYRKSAAKRLKLLTLSSSGSTARPNQ